MMNKIKEIITLDTVIVGSGCAGLNCADTLYDLGVKNIAIVTEGLYMGTSINTGSDKQTYYKLSSAGDEQDSVYDMAKTLYSGGIMPTNHFIISIGIWHGCVMPIPPSSLFLFLTCGHSFQS